MRQRCPTPAPPGSKPRSTGIGTMRRSPGAAERSVSLDPAVGVAGNSDGRRRTSMKISKNTARRGDQDHFFRAKRNSWSRCARNINMYNVAITVTTSICCAGSMLYYCFKHTVYRHCSREQPVRQPQSHNMHSDIKEFL